MKNSAWKFVSSLVISYSAGIIGSVYTAPAIDGWYSELVKPFFNPPSWVFGPVWTFLYFLIGVSLYFLWRGGFSESYNKKTFKIFLVQIVLNALWSIMFFGLHLVYFALINLILIVWLVLVLIKRLRTNYKISAYLLVPYLYWLGFATLLNFSIAILN